jgi:uncharacterized protein YdaU (DUF1376 family)
MHYYSFNIGDYTKKTAHLTNEEDLTYRRLLDHYYGSENPIPIDTPMVARKTRCSPDLVARILEEFFTLQTDGWHSKRVDEEIVKFRLTSKQAKKAAHARWGTEPPCGRIAHALPTNIQEPSIQEGIKYIEESIPSCMGESIPSFIEESIPIEESIHSSILKHNVYMVGIANAVPTQCERIPNALPDPLVEVPVGMESKRWAYVLKAREERGDNMTRVQQQSWRSVIREH